MLNHDLPLRSLRVSARVLSLALGLLALLGWSGLVAHGVASWSGWVFVTVEAAVLLLLVRSVSDRADWNTVGLLFVAGLLIRTVQIVIVQHLPHAADVLFDATLYDLNARALVSHWRGDSVSVRQYWLAGLAVRNIATWEPATGLGYAAVFGARHFLYQLYVGVVYWFAGADAGTVKLSHAVLLAALTPTVYLLARALFPERGRVATIAVALLFLDFSFAAVSAFLLKDALSALLLGLTLLSTVQLYRSARLYPAVLLTIMLVAFSVLRYHVVVAFWVTTLVMAVWTWRQRATRNLLAVVVTSFLAAALVYSPYALAQGVPHWLNGNLQTLTGGVQILKTSAQAPPPPSAQAPPPTSAQAPTPTTTSTGVPTPTMTRVPSPEAYDEATHNWLETLRANPVQAVVKTAAHTLLAPYPWVPLFHGFSYNFMELLYPGVVLWVLALPFMAFAILHRPFRSQPVAFALIMTCLIVGAYVLFHGEFSGRQRIFLLPWFWVVAAYGIDRAWTAWQVRRVALVRPIAGVGGNS